MAGSKLPSTTDLLKKYIDSPEEHNVKAALEMIKQTTFLNLVVNSCNGRKGCCFSEASVELTPYEYIRVNYRWPYVSKLANSELTFNLVSMHQLTKSNVLEQLISNGVEAVMGNPEHSQAILALLDFLHDQHTHAEAIHSVIKSDPGETSVKEGLAQHLFSQLIPSKDYLVDTSASQTPQTYSYDCKEILKPGNTFIGSSFTWHGTVDMLLNHSVVSGFGDMPGDTNNDSLDEIVDHDPVPKKVLVSENCDICTDVKKNGEDILGNPHTMDMIAAVAITNGFLQVNMHSSLSDFFIPTFGCTFEDVCIFLYDPVNDILLHGIELLKLWFNNELDIKTVVMIWLFLNFATFMDKNLSEKYEFDKAGFHMCMGEQLEDYKQLNADTSFVTAPSPVAYCRIDLIHNICKTIRPKE